MGWFDEQIRERKELDSLLFYETFENIAGAVTGKRISDALRDDSARARSAIEAILKYYHIRPREIPESIRDVNEQLEYLLRPHGIMRRRVNLTKGWRKNAFGAMLAVRREDGEVVALIPDRFQHYYFLDGKTGQKIPVTAEVEQQIEPEAIAFYLPFPLEKMDAGSLVHFMTGMLSAQDLAALVLTALAATLLGLLTPVMSKWLFGAVIYADSMTPLVAAMIFLFGQTLALLIINMLRALFTARISTKLSLCSEAAAMMRILSLPPGFFKKYSAGELANRTAYVKALCSLLVNSLLSLGLTGLFSLIYLFQIFAYASALVAPAVAMVVSMTVLSFIAALVEIRESRRQMELRSKEEGMAYSLIAGIQKIRLSGAEKRAFSRWGNAYAKTSRIAYNPPVFLTVNSVLVTAISLFGAIAIYFSASRSGVGVSDFYAFNTSYGLMTGAVTALANMALSIAKARPMLDMCAPLLETVPEISEEKAVVESLQGMIELNHVSFRYTESMPMVIDDLSLKIRPGQYVAIVGTTGCGKSTLMRLLLGFETPQKGGIFYDGRELKSMDLRSLRRKIGTVMQSGRLFQGDIYSNITISAPWLTMDDAWEAAELAGIAEDIRQMPMGMFTLISEGQGGISGGQRQRLMIARAIAPKPKILMFDEATSALDNITQKQVSDSLEKLKCTRIVIAHRLSTIQNCDRIIVLDKGHIVEDGSYQELIARKGFFAELVERQRLDGAGK